MNIGRLGRGQVIAALSGLALFIIMFIKWYGVGGSISAGGQTFSTSDIASRTGQALPTADAWQAFSTIDIILAIVIAAVVGLAVLKAAGVPLRLPVSPSALTAALGILAFALILYRIISTPGDLSSIPRPPGVSVNIDITRKVGVFLGLIAAAGIAVGGWLAMQEEGTTFGAQRDRLRDRYAGGGPGAGPPPPPPPPPPPGPSAPPPPSTGP